MCNQAVSLVAAEIERAGIPTVVIGLLREVIEKVGPPRALCVPFAHGYPLGRPDDPPGQRAVIRAALDLLSGRDFSIAPKIVDYVPGAAAKR